jgi:hypothetical protein
VKAAETSVFRQTVAGNKKVMDRAARTADRAGPSGLPIFFATARTPGSLPRIAPGPATSQRERRRSGHANDGGSHFLPPSMSFTNRSASGVSFNVVCTASIREPIHRNGLRCSADNEGSLHAVIFPPGIDADAPPRTVQHR